MDQGLPVNFENTASTWQNMPGMAAFYTGLQNQSAQDSIKMLQEAFAREQAFKEQQRPLELQRMRGDEDFKAAQAMYQRALARGTGLDSDLKAGVLPSAVEAGISKNKTGMVEDRAKAGAAENEIHGQLAAWLRGTGSQVPPTERVRVVMDRLGVKDPDGSVAAGLLQNINRLPQVLEDQHKHVIQNSADYMKQESINKTHETTANIAARASRYSADKGLEGTKYSADARVKAADAKNSAVSFELTISKLKKASEKIAALVDKANEVEATNPELAVSLRARANDPTLMGQRDAEMAAAGQSTVDPNVAPGVLKPRTSGVNVPPATGPAAPQSADPYEGRTATGPNGEKVVRKNGKWIPLQ